VTDSPGASRCIRRLASRGRTASVRLPSHMWVVPAIRCPFGSSGDFAMRRKNSSHNARARSRASLTNLSSATPPIARRA
jgi:hypothetical protein